MGIGLSFWGLESRRKTVKHTARRSNDRFGLNAKFKQTLIPNRPLASKAVSPCYRADWPPPLPKAWWAMSRRGGRPDVGKRTKGLGKPKKDNQISNRWSNVRLGFNVVGRKGEVHRSARFREQVCPSAGTGASSCRRRFATVEGRICCRAAFGDDFRA